MFSWLFGDVRDPPPHRSGFQGCPCCLGLAYRRHPLGPLRSAVAGAAARSTVAGAAGRGGLLHALAVCRVNARIVAVLLRAARNGALFLLYLMLLVWCGDIAAYYVGRAIGKHKLAPRVSPGKSWEGAIASVLGAVVVGWLCSTLFSRLPTALRKVFTSWIIHVVIAEHFLGAAR